MLRTATAAAILCACLAFAACSSGANLNAISDGADTGLFKVVRHSETGTREPALDATVELSSYTTDDFTTVSLSVRDTRPMFGVALDLEYDETRLNPVAVEFSGLVEQPLEISATRIGGLVAIAQASTLGMAARAGEFATVTFQHEAAPVVRQVTAAHSTPINESYFPAQLSAGQDGFDVTRSVADNDGPATFTIYSIFATADGDDNGQTTVADITPLIAQGNFNQPVTDGNIGPAATDYDRNGQVTIAELTPIVLQLNNILAGIEILLGNSATLADGDVLRTLTFDSGTPANRALNNPFTTNNWAFAFRTWSDSITIAEMEAADTDSDGTVFISAWASDGTGHGAAFPGIPLTYDSGPAEITSIDVAFPGSDTWPVDGDGNFIVLVTEESVDDVSDNSQNFAVEFLDLTATVDTTDETGIDGTELVVWTLLEGAGLAAVDDALGNKGHLTFDNRGKIVVEARSPLSFTAVTAEITLVLCSIDSLTIAEAGGAPSPNSVNSGITVQFEVTGSFDWDGLDNGNEVDQDLTTFCRWAGLPDAGNTGTFMLRTDLGAIETDGADSGDSIQVTCEFGEFGGELYDNLARYSELYQVIIN